MIGSIPMSSKNSIKELILNTKIPFLGFNVLYQIFGAYGF